MNATSPKKGLPLVGMAAGALVALALSPISFQLSVWFQVFDLPVDRHELAVRVLAAGFRCAQGWILLLVFSPIALIVCLLVRRRRRYALVFATMLAVLVGSFLVSTQMTRLRDEGLSRITFNAQPLLAAIEQYKTEQGVWPPNLDALKPAYIDEIPYTGAPGYPKFEYELATEETPFHEYQLYVRTPPGGSYHDRLIYWPEMNYPLWIKGASVEPLNDWAYAHRH